jgi:AraC-like DNA-binding protein
VAGLVSCRWVGSGGWTRLLRLMPDGCADLVWDGTSVLLVGARVSAGRFPVLAGSRNVGVRLLPGVAGAVAGARASSLSSLSSGPVPLADLWGARAVRRLESALAGGAGHLALERALAARLGGAGGPRPDPAVVSAARLLARPGVTVDGVAAAVGLSPRELRRRFPDHVGYGPKALHRVLRFRRFLGRAPDVVAGAASLASAAVEAGYADQSHLGRECRRLSGSSPAALVGRWAVAAGSGRKVPDAG